MGIQFKNHVVIRRRIFVDKAELTLRTETQGSKVLVYFSVLWLYINERTEFPQKSATDFAVTVDLQVCVPDILLSNQPNNIPQQCFAGGRAAG